MGAGSDWKKRREEMGKTLEEVSLELRISKKFLRGIEEGNFSRWPAKVFSCGFIRSYASYLSVDPETVQSEYFSYLEKQAVEETPVQPKPEWLERERQRGSRRTAYVGATAVVLVIGILIAWYGRYTAPRPPSLPEPAERPAASGSGAAVSSPVEQAPRPPEEPAQAGEQPGAQDGAQAPEIPPPPEQKTVTAVGGSGPVSAPYQLFLEASELTWIMYSRDGSEPVDVMLYPGDRLSIQAQEKVYLKIGNAGGVVGTLNGTLLPPFGGKGQVREITLGE